MGDYKKTCKLVRYNQRPRFLRNFKVDPVLKMNAIFHSESIRCPPPPQKALLTPLLECGNERESTNHEGGRKLLQGINTISKSVFFYFCNIYKHITSVRFCKDKIFFHLFLMSYLKSSQACMWHFCMSPAVRPGLLCVLAVRPWIVLCVLAVRPGLYYAS